MPTFRQLLEEYSVNHIKSSPYYPQTNDQADATNKTLLLNPRRMVYEENKWGANFLFFFDGHIAHRSALPLMSHLSL